MNRIDANDAAAQVGHAEAASAQMRAALDLLYGSSAEQLAGTHRVLTLCRDAEAAEEVVRNHQLVSALARLFGESEHVPVELSFALGKLFLVLSLNEGIHPMLSSHRVGALTMGVVKLELKRARHCGAARGVASATARECVFSPKQERLIFVCLSILDNFADDMAVLRKMMKLSLVALLSRCAQQKSTDSVLVTLSLLRRASVFEETAVEFSSDGGVAISYLGRLLKRRTDCLDLCREVIVTLFNLSFHQKCTHMISASGIHPTLLVLLRKPPLHDEILQLMYHLSDQEEDRQRFFEAGITSELMDLLQYVSSGPNLNWSCLAGLLMNVSQCVLNRFPSFFLCVA